MADREFVPADFAVPRELVAPPFRLEPLGPQHNAADYAADLNTLNQSKNFNPGNPPAVCPTSNTVDNGTQEWSNNGYPKQSGQILECLTVQTNGTGPNTIPDYLWTLPSKNVIFDSYGYPGMSMQTLDTWWQNHSAPGP